MYHRIQSTSSTEVKIVLTDMLLMTHSKVKCFTKEFTKYLDLNPMVMLAKVMIA